MQLRHVQPIRRNIQGRWPALAERLVRPHLVEGTPEHIEAPLLGAERERRGPGGLGFQVLVHALVPAVLVPAGGLDELGANPQPEPPDTELGEAAECAGGKGLPIVRADPLREPVGAEEPPEDLVGRLQQRPLESLARQQIARVGVLDSERIAVAAIAQAELALEVDRPDDIGTGDRGLGPPGMGRIRERRRRRTRPWRTRIR